jgi:hypothetical protein
VVNESSEPATGYAIVLPPTWRKIPLRQGTDQAIRKIQEEVFARLPPDVPRDRVTPYRVELERRLGGLVAEARKASGLDLYLPVMLMHDAPVAASFVVSEVSFGSQEEIDPGLIAVRLAAGTEDSATVSVDGAVGVRIERVGAPEPGKEIETASRRVDYVISVPGDPDRWLEIAFSTLGGGDPSDQYAKLLVELFDAIMSTFRWTQAQAG